MWLGEVGCGVVWCGVVWLGVVECGVVLLGGVHDHVHITESWCTEVLHHNVILLHCSNKVHCTLH